MGQLGVFDWHSRAACVEQTVFPEMSDVRWLAQSRPAVLTMSFGTAGRALLHLDPAVESDFYVLTVFSFPQGDFCPYRHEPSALGCETMCTYWQQGNCLNEHCNFRHMELKVNIQAAENLGRNSFVSDT